MDRVGRAEPSNLEDGNGAVYTTSLVQSPLLLPKEGADKALYNPKVLGVMVRQKADFQGVCQTNSSQS